MTTLNFEDFKRDDASPSQLKSPGSSQRSAFGGMSRNVVKNSVSMAISNRGRTGFTP